MSPDVEKKMKPASTLDVAFSFSSNLLSNTLPLYDENKQQIVSNGNFICDEAATLEIMMTNYMQKRFHGLDKNSDTRVTVSLDSLYAQEFYERNGKRVKVTPSSSRKNLTHVSEVQIVVTVTIDNKGEILTQSFKGRQNVSSLLREEMMCDALYEANNQILEQMEDFLVANGL
jgi:hypothetical protein